MHLIEIAFKGNRKEFFRWEAESPPALRAALVVEADRGEDVGRVHSTGDLAAKRASGVAHRPGPEGPARRALRLASSEDVRQLEAIRAEDEPARRTAMQHVRSNGLVMKLTDAEWQWDRKKLTIWFTAEKRVDFRNLVRDLAAQFRTRIELKQIGVRDEARRLGGVGRCGREYCSASWLPELRPVNLGIAKDQRLSLNPTQISGACGRLMCCLRHEHEFYVQARKRFPKEGRIIYSAVGEERVVSNDIFNERVTLRNVDGETRVLPLEALKLEIQAAGSATPPSALTTSTAEFEAVVLPEELSEELISLQDTAERPAWRPGMGKRLGDRPVVIERRGRRGRPGDAAGDAKAAAGGAKGSGATAERGGKEPAGRTGRRRDDPLRAAPESEAARATNDATDSSSGAAPSHTASGGTAPASAASSAEPSATGTPRGDQSDVSATADATHDAERRQSTRRRGRRGGRRGRGNRGGGDGSGPPSSPPGAPSGPPAGPASGGGDAA
ncbi:MAG TPA: regulatory iron-sulfur-containing complex subunit RicT [Gemmatimonadaceae bacterium]|nr:regulatory iron-sulfur-containing complex subunit RicT [Gemmatimonadaceae bacterium]